MSFLICQKHNKVQKTSSKVPTNAHVCMNRYCPESFKVFCAACKNDHRDHAIKILTLEDVSFLVDRLLKTPFKEVGRYVGESVDVMKKLKLIKQFRKKIDILEKEIQKQGLKLVDNTQSLIHQYAICKGSVTALGETLTNIEEPQNYKLFFEKSNQMLSNLDYNFKKDKLQFGNALIKEKEDKRRKSLDCAKRKIEEVRDYSMKIIEVILHNEDSQEDEDDIAFKKKHYQLLKQQLCLDKDEQQLDQEISDLKNSKSTANKSRIKRSSCLDMECQTHSQILSREEAASELEERLSQIKQSHLRAENDLRLKVSVMAKQKQNISRQLGKMKQKLQQRKRTVKEIQTQLRENKGQRSEKQRMREQLVNKIIELWQLKGLTSQDKAD